jgi:hypothetical protein
MNYLRVFYHSFTLCDGNLAKCRSATRRRRSYLSVVSNLSKYSGQTVYIEKFPCFISMVYGAVTNGFDMFEFADQILF